MFLSKRVFELKVCLNFISHWKLKVCIFFSEILLFEPQASLGFLDFLLLLFLCQDKKSKEWRKEILFLLQMPNKISKHALNSNVLLLNDEILKE